MQVRIDPEDEPAGERLLRGFLSRRAELQIVLDGLPKRLAQFANGLALEGNDIPEIIRVAGAR